MGTYFAMITDRTYEQLTPVCDNVSAWGSEILSRSVCQLFIVFCNIVNCLRKGLKEKRGTREGPEERGDVRIGNFCVHCRHDSRGVPTERRRPCDWRYLYTSKGFGNLWVHFFVAIEDFHQNGYRRKMRFIGGGVGLNSNMLNISFAMGIFSY